MSGAGAVTTHYDRLAGENLAWVFASPTTDLAARLGAHAQGERYRFSAFGQDCRLSADGIGLDDKPATGVTALLIALYARHAIDAEMVVEPLKAFAEMPDSAPYAAAFRSHSETLLVPHVDRVLANRDRIVERFNGHPAPPEISGDWAILLQPLPKISLCYSFYAADEEFPPAATCLFSANAAAFLPTDALADVAEYTSRAIIDLSAAP
jgi:hypothetical protein